ncbi:hypothetical protein [Desulfonema magnum]|uniref:Uncharacterized protein n=1 Tax=Desulfonema magnum TaxID=45655 RepID=A0A975BV23_9BACT|nr:hypothetical protein [Desulfonema magnum]QTA91660.1 Uncharacterized protein dnm_077330 [Desulfonema magnum]
MAEADKDTVIETEFRLNEDDSDDFTLLVKKIIHKDAKTKDMILHEKVLPPFSQVHYIAADRLGPLKYHDKVNFGNFINTGSKGQFL